MIVLLASFLISTNATARELVMNCRTLVPSAAELRGRIVLRNRKGIAQAEHDYVLTRKDGRTSPGRYCPVAMASRSWSNIWSASGRELFRSSSMAEEFIIFCIYFVSSADLYLRRADEMG